MDCSSKWKNTFRHNFLLYTIRVYSSILQEFIHLIWYIAPVLHGSTLICTQFTGHFHWIKQLAVHHGCFPKLRGTHPFCFRLDSSVIVVVNILRNGALEGFKRWVVLLKAIKHFVFQSAKERFHDAIIIAVALPGHGLNHTVLRKFIPVKLMLVLPALIRVHDQPLHRRKSLKRFHQHILDLLQVWGLGEPNLIYVKNFCEAPRKSLVQNHENHSSGMMKTEIPESTKIIRDQY